MSETTGGAAAAVERLPHPRGVASEYVLNRYDRAVDAMRDFGRDTTEHERHVIRTEWRRCRTELMRRLGIPIPKSVEDL